jgi:mannose-6-phosphate isomerase-like protein (cupin superfamily)
MRSFTLADPLRRQRAATDPYVELIRVPDLSFGLYLLTVGAEDPQQPHTEDEVYVVLAGHAKFTAGDETRDCGPGDMIFVPACEPHRFHDITDELQVVVMFGPAEFARAPGTTGSRTSST